MKVKTTTYGIFYKNGDKWIGPYNGELLPEMDNETLELYKKECRRFVKKPVKLFRQLWKSVD